MNGPEVVVVNRTEEEDPTSTVVNEGGISRKVPRNDPGVLRAVGMMAAMGVRRRDVMRTVRAKRLEQRPIVPGGGAREKARRLRQMAQRGEEHGSEGSK